MAGSEGTEDGGKGKEGRMLLKNRCFIFCVNHNTLPGC